MSGIDTALSAYVRAAIKRAQCDWLAESQEYFCAVPELQGAWSTGKSKDEARSELSEVIGDWVQLGLRLHHYIPIVEGIDLNPRSDSENGAHEEPQRSCPRSVQSVDVN